MWLELRRSGFWVVLGAFGWGCADDEPNATADTGESGSVSSGEATSSTTEGSSGTGVQTSGETGSLEEPLRFDHLQGLGTHNSYHVAPDLALSAWDYTHRPLDEQLEIGVRQFELDIYLNAERGGFDVYHVDQLDEGTTCATLAECITTMAAWSQAHPHHHPILVLLEPKDNVTGSEADAWIEALESSVTASWPEDRLLVPDMVARTHGSLRAGLEAEGWPTIDELRGHALFVLHDGGELRDAYVASGIQGRALFPDAMGDLDADYAAFHSMNDPVGGADGIAAAVAAGHLVRTRADADNVEPNAGDVTRRDAALESGAHFVSTDWPEPASSGYVVEIPGGTPSRCNPLRAPAGCTSELIEDPATLGQ